MNRVMGLGVTKQRAQGRENARGWKEGMRDEDNQYKRRIWLHLLWEYQYRSNQSL